MKKTNAILIVLVGTFVAVMPLMAETEVANGIEWTYSRSGNTATVTGFTPRTGYIVFPEQLGGCTNLITGTWAFYGYTEITGVVLPESLTALGQETFYNCSNLQEIVLPSRLTTIGAGAFRNCSSLRKLIIPASVTKIENSLKGYNYSWLELRAFGGCSKLQVVIFEGLPPDDFEYCGLGTPPSGYGSGWVCPVAYKKEFAVQWREYVDVDKFSGYYKGTIPKVTIESTCIRENDPTVLDVVYTIASVQPRVKVRALAFEDGERSLTKIVRPETFVKDEDGNETAQSIGDDVEVNVPHKLSWKVSDDWATRLAKVKLEILVCEGDLLPLELRTIPASDQYGKMKISWNAISESQVFDALLWLYADKDPGLTLAGGVLKNGSTQLASGASTSNPNAIRYIYSKMGYQLLTGAPLNYANSETRLGLSPSGVRQYAYKIVQE